jgi:predicted O-methyltransferase YrrM
MGLPMGIFERLTLQPISRRRPQTGRADKQQQKWAAVDRYIAERFVPSDLALDTALQASQAAGLPSINVSPGQGKLLMLLASSIGARSILEIGTLGGYSTIWLARALKPEGRLITLEANPHHAKIALNNIARAGFANSVELRLGRAIDLLPTLASDGPFDFIFIDADHVNTAEYFQWSLKLSHRGSLIVVDNVVRRGTILDAEAPKPAIQGLRRFYDFAAAEPNVSMTAIQTVGAKDHDGFAIALVTADP